MKEGVLSKSEKQFVLEALKQNLRVDCRKHNEYRRLKITYGDVWGSCLVTLGNTKVLGEISCDIDEPKASRPNEGLLFINVELSPMAAAHFESGRQSELGVRVGRLMERCFKESSCVDLEALCIVAEEKVWALHLDLRVVNHDGNLVDACSIASLASLAHFRRPDVTLTGSEVTVHPPEERDPIPLSLHHQPVSVSFAVFVNGEYVVLDPTGVEERVAEASLVFGINGYRELCTLQLGGASLPSAEVVLRYAELAAKRASESIAEVRKALSADLEDRAAGRPVGFAASVRREHTTSEIQDFEDIMLNRPVEVVEEDKDSDDDDEEEEEDDKDEVMDDKDEVMDDKDEIMDDKDVVVPLANGTAELLPKPHKHSTKRDVHPDRRKDKQVPKVEVGKIGEGGPSTWTNVDSSDSEIEMIEEKEMPDEIEVMEEIEKKAIVRHNIEEVDLADSEEEETVTLDSGSFKDKSKAGKKTKEKSRASKAEENAKDGTRGWYPSKW